MSVKTSGNSHSRFIEEVNGKAIGAAFFLKINYMKNLDYQYRI